MLCSQKKGSILDVLSLVLFMFIFVILVVSIGIAQKKTGDALDESIAYLNDSIPAYEENADIFVKNTVRFSSFWDFLILFVIVGVWLIMFVSAWSLGNNPVFMVFYVVISFAILVTSFVLWIAGDEIFSSPNLYEFVVDYPIVSWFMQDAFFIFSIFFVVTIGIALYLKPGKG